MPNLNRNEETRAPTSGSTPDGSVSRRSFLHMAGAGVLFSQTSALAELFGFMRPVDFATPLANYPNRGWEKTYRDLYHYDSSFHFLCAPNDTHNCLLTAYVKNDVVVRIGPSFGFGLAKDPDGNQASHRWDPRCCNKGLSLIRRFYGHRRCKEPMIRRGFREWVDAGFPRDAETGKVPDQYLNRGQDPYEKVTWEQAYAYSAKALKNISETYSGAEGQEKLKAQGYDPAMAEATRGAGTQTLKFRGGMAALGATRIFAQYRNANVMALLDAHIRGVGPEEALGGRGFRVFEEFPRNHRDDRLGESARGDEFGGLLLARGSGLTEHHHALCLRVFLEEFQNIDKGGPDQQVPSDGYIGGLPDSGAGESERDLRAHPPAPADDPDRAGPEHQVRHLAPGPAHLGFSGGEHALAVGPDDQGPGLPGPGENLAGIVVGHPLGDDVDDRNAPVDGLEGGVPGEAGRNEKHG